MGKRSYHHYCSLAHALDLIGERWTLLIVRDLLLGAKRYKDLLQGLPGIGTNILAARLKELEESHIVQRRVLPPPAGSTVYELTEYGRELDAILMALAHWGAKSQGPREPEQILRPITPLLGLRESFHAETARQIHMTYEMRFDDDEIYTIRVAGGHCEVQYGTALKPDLVITVDVDTFVHLQRKQQMPEDAIKNGTLHLDGDPDHFAQFLDLFDEGKQQSETTAK